MSQTEVAPVGADSPFSPTDAAALVSRLRSTYDAGVTRPLEWRHRQLAGLLRMIREREGELCEALCADLGRAPFEAWAADLRTTAREIEDVERHLDTWAKPERGKVPWLLRPGKAQVVREPLGVVLVIAPWNYPVQLLLAPMAAALAAGNAVVAKPSEVSSATSAALARIIPDYLDPDAVAVVEGGVVETTALLDQRWDHILYTGNGTVGRIVAAAAAKHLTPVTLELGGKSPSIVTADANLELAASRIAFSKFLNTGQTCVASDHVWVAREVEQEFLTLLTDQIRKRYGTDPRSSDLGRIINSGHAQRLKNLIDAGGFEVVTGGEVDVEAQYVAPTVVRAVSPDAAVMGEEIFGPILPVLTFDRIEDATSAISAGDKPLALYLFTSSRETEEFVVAHTSSGGVCVNDAIDHLLVSALPFGGVGDSGYGAYHGRWGFEAFSHRKAVFRRPAWVKDAPLLNPPYSKWKQFVTRRVF